MISWNETSAKILVRPSSPLDPGEILHSKRPRLPFPIGVAVAIVTAPVIMLAIPSGVHLVFGGSNKQPLGWSSPLLVSTAVASIVGVVFLAWRPPSAEATIVAMTITAAVMTGLTVVQTWESRDWWLWLMYYFAVTGIVFALPTAAAVLHGRDGLRFQHWRTRQLDARFHPHEDR